MKTSNCHANLLLLLGLCVVSTRFELSAAAFAVVPNNKAKSSSALWSSSSPSSSADQGALARLAFPLDVPLTRIEGGGTVRTWNLPVESDRAHIFLKSNGRPMRAKVELWIGPIRTVHTMNIAVEDGNATPYRSLIKFKKDIGPTIRVTSSEDEQLPCYAGVLVPAPEDSKRIGTYTEKLWESSPKTSIQGGPISGGHGAVRVFPIDANVDRVQLICWSRDTSKKSLKAVIELMQGPNNPIQSYELQCGGGTQPFHAVFETPGAGWVIRIYNKKFIEDGLFEVAIVPFDSPEEGRSIRPMGGGGSSAQGKRWYD